MFFTSQIKEFAMSNQVLTSELGTVKDGFKSQQKFKLAGVHCSKKICFRKVNSSSLSCPRV